MTLKVNEIIDLIVSKSEYTKAEVRQMIDDTVESMDNMVTEEGAAYVVAENLNVSLEGDQTTQAFKINQLIPGQSNIAVMGRIQKIYPVNTFNRKDGTTGRVRSIELIDKGGTLRVALWDAKCDIIETKNIAIGDIVTISGGSTREGRDGIELSLGLQGKIDNVDGKDDDFPEVKVADEVKLDRIDSSLNSVSIVGKITDIGGVREFNRKDGGTGKVCNITVKDLKAQVSITFWNETTDILNDFSEGDSVRITDLRVGENRYNELQLTFNTYSTIKTINQPEFDAIKVMTGGTLQSLSELADGMKNVTVIGKIAEIADLKTFERNGEERKVQNITIMDNSAMVKVTFWGDDTGIIAGLANGQIIQITKCRARLNDYSKEVEITYSGGSKITNVTDAPADKFEPSSETISLNDVTETIRGVNVKGMITRKFEVRDVELSDGREAKVLNLTLQDATGFGTVAKVAFWDDTISKAQDLEENTGILMQNVRVKPGSGDYGPEISVNKSTIISPVDLADMPIIATADTLGSKFEKTDLNRLVDDSKVRVQGTIVNAFPPTIYPGCTQCARKVTSDDGLTGECKEHGETKVVLKMIISLQLDDGSDTTSIKFFDKKAEALAGMSAAEADQKMKDLSDNRAVTDPLMMKEMWVEGRVKTDVERSEQQITVSNFGDVSYEAETDDLLSDIDKYDADW